MAEFKKIDDVELEEITGGARVKGDNGYRMVCRLKKGYLAVRTKPYYNDANIIGQLYNGDKVRIVNFTLIKSSDGVQYYLVYSPKLRKQGYVNAAYLRRY